MPIAATIEAISLMPAFLTPLEVAAENRRAAHLDRGHDAPLHRGHRRAMLFPVSFAVAAEYIRHFQLRAVHLGPPLRSIGAW